MGGQRSLRSYWRNYYERTDALIWVVDSADTGRMLDCKAELQNLLKEEKLAGAALLIFANKQDLPSALAPEEIMKVSAGPPASRLGWHVCLIHHHMLGPILVRAQLEAALCIARHVLGLKPVLLDVCWSALHSVLVIVVIQLQASFQLLAMCAGAGAGAPCWPALACAGLQCRGVDWAAGRL